MPSMIEQLVARLRATPRRTRVSRVAIAAIAAPVLLAAFAVGRLIAPPAPHQAPVSVLSAPSSSAELPALLGSVAPIVAWTELEAPEPSRPAPVLAVIDHPAMPVGTASTVAPISAGSVPADAVPRRSPAAVAVPPAASSPAAPSAVRRPHTATAEGASFDSSE
jgi:hypothetical protein